MASGSRHLPSGLAARPPWPYWTDRRRLNGVVELSEGSLGDALLEEIIVGVMNDIKTWLIANNRLEYSSWVDIQNTPKAIIRATTFGAVASLYARRIYAPLRHVVSAPPASAKKLPEKAVEEASMEYWEGRMENALEGYLSKVGATRLWVDTSDEEPTFSMDDIPIWKTHRP